MEIKQKYTYKEYNEQIILVTKGWGFDNNEFTYENKIEKIQHIISEQVKIPKEYIKIEIIYNKLYDLVKEYIGQDRIDYIFNTKIPKEFDSECKISMHNIIKIMMSELFTISKSESLQLNPIYEILKL